MVPAGRTSVLAELTEANYAINRAISRLSDVIFDTAATEAQVTTAERRHAVMIGIRDNIWRLRVEMDPELSGEEDDDESTESVEPVADPDDATIINLDGRRRRTATL